ncbi:MAG: efflux RND transporter periplasmic adaptor subunit [Candidatus Levybacteria bacterium]|nr:efflux RND transporter periplasmic adaptor subunit [Candidatus Levybacteria bacterium]
MNITDLVKKPLGFLKWILGNKARIAIFIVLLLVVGYFGYKNFVSSNQVPIYQTAQAEKGTLITSVTASGQVTTANNVQITTQAAGVVKDVMVKNGDTLTQGQTIATLTLDQASQQKAASAWSSYLSAKNNLDSAQAKINSLQAAEFKANQTFINDAVARGLATDDPTYIQENALWFQAEADYKNHASVITQAQASLNSAALTLSQTSSTITAPAGGIIKGLTITPGAIVTVTSSSTNATSTSQVLGSVYQEGPIQAQVNISEIDSVKVAEGQKVTMTLDAFPNLTFTGKIVTINTNGVTSSGVTNYPAVISFDSGNDHIYPNMGVNASIITDVKNNVILVPSGAIQTSNGQSTVRVMRNGQETSVPVEIGKSSDTQTEIVSGINEGDTVITGQTSTTGAGSTGTTTSPFGNTRGGFGGAGGFGGGAVRGGGGGR